MQRAIIRIVLFPFHRLYLSVRSRFSMSMCVCMFVCAQALTSDIMDVRETKGSLLTSD